jgi:8-oxo-dGTP diphosphatase
MISTPDGASAALIRGNEVLLIRRAYAPFRSLWTLPGGGIEPGESAEACAAREVEEEVGLRVSGLKYLEMQVARSVRGAYRLAVFATDRFEGEVRPSDEVADHQWITPENLHAVRTTSRLHEVIARAFVLVAGQ